MRDRFLMLGCADNEYPLKSTALLHFEVGIQVASF